MAQPLYDCKSAGSAVGLSPQQVRLLARQLKLGRKLGGAWIFDEVDIAALEKRRRRGAPKKAKS